MRKLIYWLLLPLAVAGGGRGGGGGEELLEAVCKGRGFLMKGGVCDYDRCCAVVLDEFRAGKLGRMTLEMPVKKARLTIPGAKKDDESKPQEENSDGED